MAAAVAAVLAAVAAAAAAAAAAAPPTAAAAAGAVAPAAIQTSPPPLQLWANAAASANQLPVSPPSLAKTTNLKPAAFSRRAETAAMGWTHSIGGRSAGFDESRESDGDNQVDIKQKQQSQGDVSEDAAEMIRSTPSRKRRLHDHASAGTTVEAVRGKRRRRHNDSPGAFAALYGRYDKRTKRRLSQEASAEASRGSPTGSRRKRRRRHRSQARRATATPPSLQVARRAAVVPEEGAQGVQ
eukprot:GHVU01009475.1.p2 GENE.GHVU01009475.1~~GHVU01009475.1.p2  ORF type:complete len:241 (-),score=45.69 GHVU01009475.1:130-852(-)